MKDNGVVSKGARKLIVTELYPGKEEPADDVEWRPASGSVKIISTPFHIQEKWRVSNVIHVEINVSCAFI